MGRETTHAAPFPPYFPPSKAARRWERKKGVGFWLGLMREPGKTTQGRTSGGQARAGHGSLSSIPWSPDGALMDYRHQEKKNIQLSPSLTLGARYPHP
jgi:hypothetical protein